MSRHFPYNTGTLDTVRIFAEQAVLIFFLTSSHARNLWRTTNEEKRALERQNFDQYNDVRRASEVHRQVRQFARRNIKPGMSMIEIVEMIENGTRNLVEANGFESGIGFPTGCSLNHCAAHYTPNTGDKTVIQYGDVCKIDFGVHVNGNMGPNIIGPVRSCS